MRTMFSLLSLMMLKTVPLSWLVMLPSSYGNPFVRFLPLSFQFLVEAQPRALKLLVVLCLLLIHFLHGSWEMIHALLFFFFLYFTQSIWLLSFFSLWLNVFFLCSFLFSFIKCEELSWRSLVVCSRGGGTTAAAAESMRVLSCGTNTCSTAAGTFATCTVGDVCDVSGTGSAGSNWSSLLAFHVF